MIQIEYQNLLDYDELKCYFEVDYSPTDKITIKQPKIQDVINYGDIKFYSMINSLCGNTTSFRLQLWKIGINWNKYSDFDLFCMMIKNYTPDDTRLLFGDLNLSWFEKFHNNETDSDVLINIPRDKNGEMIPIDMNDAIIIDEIVYIKIVEYLRYMFDIHPKVERAKNNATAEAMIWEEEENLKIQEMKNKDKKVESSILLPLVSSALNHPGFKYKKSELKEIGIVEFMDSIKRLQIYESTRALMSGMYSGMCDLSKVPKEEFNFMRSTN